MSAPLFFRIYKNGQIYVVKQFVNDERIVIGNGAGVQIDLQSPEVSSIHCLVEHRENGYFLCDLGSEQGTFINGQAVLDQSIASGDAFNVGPFQIFFMQGNQKNIELEQFDRQDKTKKDNLIETLIQPLPTVAITPIEPVVEPTVTTTQKIPIPVQDEQAPPIAEVEVTPTPPVVVAPVVAPIVQAPPPAAKVAPPVTKQEKPTAILTRKVAAPAKANALKDFIRVGAGSRVEVIVSWRERIINTYHFSEKGERTLGVNGDISVPEGSAPPNWKILSYNGTHIEVTTSPEMKVEIIRDGDLIPIRENKLAIREGEVCFIELNNGMQLAIRFAPKAPLIAFDSPFVLGISEFTGVLAALILAVVTSLIVSVNKPAPEKVEEEIERVAKVVFTKPPQPIAMIQDPTPVEKPPEPPKPEPPKKEPVVQKVSLEDKKQPDKKQGPTTANPDKNPDKSTSGKAAEVKPKDSKLKAKMFTSTKQGGQIKTGDVDGANAKSKEPDLKNTGILAAFGTGGARNKLDKAYSGSGELLGAGEKATGASGFKSNSAGDDLGSRAKDTGAGGAGTATQGIAGVGTQGRGTGMAGLGSSTGFGDKGKVQIAAGGNEEEFTGSIDKEAVRRVVKSALAQFKACYEREYRMNSRLEGKVVIQWEIHEQGVAKNAQVVRVKSTINNSAVEDCVKNRMMALKFPEPPPGTAAEVTYPFIFQGQKL